MPKKSVKKSIGHDNLFVSAVYPSGGRFRFSVSRSGERLTAAGADGAAGRRQFAVLADWTKFRPGETNGGRIERIYAAANAVDSIGDLVRAIETPATAVTAG